MSESEIRKLLNKLPYTNKEAVFRQFYHLCYDRFFRIAYYYTHNEAWSQEIVLDAFMKLWEKRDSLFRILGIEDYCFVLVKNTALNYLAKEEKRRGHLSLNEVEPSGKEISPEEVLLSEELFAAYVKALDALPERCREVFIRIKEEKKNYVQVGEEMGISVKTVDAHLQKAVGKLKEAIRNYLSEPIS